MTEIEALVNQAIEDARRVGRCEVYADHAKGSVAEQGLAATKANAEGRLQATRDALLSRARAAGIPGEGGGA